MANLTQALTDLRDEIVNGEEIDDIIVEIAEDYGVNPILLQRKFEESYTSVESVRATARAIDERTYKTREKTRAETYVFTREDRAEITKIVKKYFPNI